MPSMALTCHICNKPMQKSRTSKPQGEAAHNACRKQAFGSCVECGSEAIAKNLCPVHYSQVARGVLGIERPTCIVCGDPISRITSSARPMHKPCKDRAPKWLKQGLPDPRPQREAKRLARLAEQGLPAVLIDKRTDIRAGYEDGDYDRFLAGVRSKVEVSEATQCWAWQGRLHKGYPVVNFRDRAKQVHRLVIEAREGKPLGVLAAHHTCANRTCVNPDHLQPVTSRENTAEMMARTSLEARILELEAALTAVSPDHPALHRVSHLRLAS